MNREVHVRFSEGLGLKYPGLLDTAIPELLSALYIKGLLVTIDAMGCQRKIASQITVQGGDFVLAVKGNQPTLFEAIETAFIDQHESTGVDRHRHVNKSHGRIVGQIAAVLPALGVVDLADWPGCKTIGRIDPLRQVGDKESPLERRYYISSRALSAEQLPKPAKPEPNRLKWDGSVTRSGVCDERTAS